MLRVRSVSVRSLCKRLAWFGFVGVFGLAVRIFPRLRYVIEEQLWFWSLPAHERMRVKCHITPDSRHIRIHRTYRGV